MAATLCNTLQHTATHRNTLQHNASRRLCVWLQHTLHIAATDFVCGCNVGAVSATSKWLHTRLNPLFVLLQLTVYTAATQGLSLQLASGFTAVKSSSRIAATDCMYCCNLLYIWLQLTLYTATTDSTYNCNWLFTWLQLTPYMAATDSIYSCNRLNI